MTKSRDPQKFWWLITINNPQPTFTHDKIKEIAVLGLKTLVFLAMCDEIGNQTHTYHTHVLICCRSAVRFSTIQKLFPGAHLDPAKGKIQDLIDYLKKSGKWVGTSKAETSVPGTYEEVGTCPSDYAGSRQDLAELYDMIVVNSMSNAEIIAHNPDYILQIDKLDKIRSTYLFEKYRNHRRLNLEVTYVSGPTAVGKTRAILDEWGDGAVYRVTSEKNPFDGYSCENVMCFEEFRANFKLKDMLNYLDVYPLKLDARYSDRCACYEHVYIVSNWPLEYQYVTEQKIDRVSYAAFLSRIHRVKVYTPDGITLYNSVAEYFKAKDIELPAGYKQRIPLASTDAIEDNNTSISEGTTTTQAETNSEPAYTAEEISRPSIDTLAWMNQFYHPERRIRRGETTTNTQGTM